MGSYDMLEQAPAPGNDEDAMVRDLLRMIFEQIWWVIAIAACVTLGAYWYAKSATRIYSADALIQVESSSGNTPGGAQALAALAPAGGTHTDAEIEILRSRTVVEPVVEQFKLNFSAWPKTMPYLGHLVSMFAHPGHPIGAPFGLTSYAWGGEEFSVESITVPTELQGTTLTLHALGQGRYELRSQSGWLLLTGVAGQMASSDGVSILVKRLVARPGTEFFVTRFNQLDAVGGLAGGLQVAEKGTDTGIVQLSFMGTDPVLITAIVNAVGNSYLKQRQDRAQEEASRMLSFLNSEMPRIRDEVNRAETALAEYQSHSGSFHPSSEASLYLGGEIEYEKQIATMRVTRAQLLTQYTAESPEVKSIDAQLAAMIGEKTRFESQYATMPQNEREALSLQRDAKVAEQIYIALMNRIQELSITRAGTVSNVHMIDEALVPSSPIKPKPGMIISAGAVLGIMAGIAFAVCRRTLFTGISDASQLERRFGMPIFGVIANSAQQNQADQLALEARSHAAALPGSPEVVGPSRMESSAAVRMPGAHAPFAPARPLLAKTHPFDPSIEGLRGLRATLQFGLFDAPNRVVAFTSPAPSDGKSFLCANLAALLAETGRRVLLIDADLRRGRLAHYLGRSSKGGLTELLTGQGDLDVIAQPTGVEGLHFIAAGAYPPNPSEILSSARFSELLEHFERQFDLVIIDTPPLLAVPDAASVANIAGSTVLVMRAGANTQRNIAESLEKLRRARARLIGGVLNAVPQKSAGRYGASDYSYAYLYTADDVPAPATAKRRRAQH
ncbi:polysaccharide biosynthesis tyrosine autokinase [Paraburkholderia sp. J67]|uniref:polysaccharide biosynthesis tyrosine autokinase n=1 Tax=Paraburkholderia sp. J67 TaxID=2805435 RepID=UPI002ABE1A6A|nr:polysaccharide biosynthesis tyrosine autokinase [Paraburkholderia sp. J67]